MGSLSIISSIMSRPWLQKTWSIPLSFVTCWCSRIWRGIGPMLLGSPPVPGGRGLECNDTWLQPVCSSFIRRRRKKKKKRRISEKRSKERKTRQSRVDYVASLWIQEAKEWVSYCCLSALLESHDNRKSHESEKEKNWGSHTSPFHHILNPRVPATAFSTLLLLPSQLIKCNTPYTFFHFFEMFCMLSSVKVLTSRNMMISD